MTGRSPREVAALLDLYLVTDAAACGDRGVVETVRRAVQGGVTLVQVRDHHLGTRDLVALVEAVRDAVAGTGVPVVVNDRVDVALATGADGVHLGQSDLPAAVARQLLGPRALVGLSVSTPEQVTEAEALNADGVVVDHLGVGPVWATPTKPEAAAPLGTDRLAELVAQAHRADLPCVAIGGIGPDNAASVRAAGVDGIAVVSAICAAADPAAAATGLRGRS